MEDAVKRAQIDGISPKRSTMPPAARRRATDIGIDAEDDACSEAAVESIDLMKAVEHPGEFSPLKPARRRAKAGDLS